MDESFVKKQIVIVGCYVTNQILRQEINYNDQAGNKKSFDA